MYLLSNRVKFALHILQLCLIVCVIGLSVPRLFMKGQPRTRANTIALGMGAKSIIIISYQLLTEHVSYFYRWASLKANAILNGLEIVFWAAVVFLVLQGVIKSCVGVGCILSWIVVGISLLICLLVVWVFAISMINFRTSRHGQGTEKARDALEMEHASMSRGVPV